MTGIVDAVSILALGRVFVANMTGNVVFIGFALAGATGFSAAGSLAGLVGGGRLIRWNGNDRARLIAGGSAFELVLVGAALLVTVLAGTSLPPISRDLVAALLAVGPGMQNAVVRRLAVPDLTTTVLTMTLTGIAADVRHGNPAQRSPGASSPSRRCSPAPSSEPNWSFRQTRPRRWRWQPRCWPS